jgi:hypothetical protein
VVSKIKAKERLMIEFFTTPEVTLAVSLFVMAIVLRQLFFTRRGYLASAKKCDEYNKKRLKESADFLNDYLADRPKDMYAAMRTLDVINEQLRKYDKR